MEELSRMTFIIYFFFHIKFNAVVFAVYIIKEFQNFSFRNKDSKHIIDQKSIKIGLIDSNSFKQFYLYKAMKLLAKRKPIATPSI